MQKLLIVLAIQFCLPACSALLARLSPRAVAWHLEFYVVLINAAFFGFALGLLPKRGAWIVGIGALFAAYAAVWLPAYLKLNTFNYTPHQGAAYFEYLGCTALFVALLGGFLFQDYTLVCELPAEQYGKAAAYWQFRLPDLFWATGLVAFAALGIVAYYRYDRQPIDDELFVLTGGDYVYAAIGLPFFYYVLRPGMNWRWLACWGVGMLLVLLAIQPLISHLTDYLDHLFFVFSLALLALCSALLYRWAGLRIVDYRTRSFWAFERPGKR
jgi:hypothetical protein